MITITFWLFAMGVPLALLGSANLVSDNEPSSAKVQIATDLVSRIGWSAPGNRAASVGRGRVRIATPRRPPFVQLEAQQPGAEHFRFLPYVLAGDAMVATTEEILERALQATRGTMDRQRLLRQMWQLAQLRAVETTAATNGTESGNRAPEA